jgi:phospholipase C
MVALGLLAGAGPTSSGAAATPTRAITATPIQHVVILFQENHSFDNVLGWLCVQDDRCDGAITGKTSDGQVIPLPTAPDFIPRMAHGSGSQITALNDYQMNGWNLLHGCTEQRDYKCYQQFHTPEPGNPGSIPNLSALARNFVISDRTFQSGFNASWVAHLSLVASLNDGFTGAQPHRVKDNPKGEGWGCDSYWDALWQDPSGGAPFDVPACVPDQAGNGPYRESPVPWVPTIMDRMDAAGQPWLIYGAPTPFDGYYSQTICPTFYECSGPTSQQRNKVVITDRFVTDAKNGALPNLSIVIPRFEDSQHNLHSMLQGDNFIAQAVGAVMNGPDWDSTAIFITYDDCGCFYDHAVPPVGLGLRTPMVIVSPWAKKGFTDSNTASYNSILAFTEHAFGLNPLSSIDAAAYDYSMSFDYTQRPLPPIRLKQHRVSAAVLKLIANAPLDNLEAENARIAADWLREGPITDALLGD